jgi:flagellar basal body rod protein FlgB
MIKALFGPSSPSYGLRQALDASMQRQREIAQRVAAALTSSTQGSGEGGATGATTNGEDLVQDMAALADTQIRYEAEARLLHAAYERLRSAIGKNG